MKSIKDTFVRVSVDCPVDHCVIPVSKNESKSVHLIQYELLTERPYYYGHEDLIFQVYLVHNGIPLNDTENSHAYLREELFQKPHACLRASMLPKKFGWGVHYNEEGRIALYGMDSPEYNHFLENSDGKLTLHYAMRNKKEKK